MSKCIFVSVALIFLLIQISCSPAKYTSSVKLNDIDSVIRIINPNHNCGCNWEDKTFKIYAAGSFAKNSYFYNSVYIKNIDSFDILKDSKKIKDQLVKLDPAFKDYSRFFLEYRIVDNTNADTSIKHKVVGTWFDFKNSCSGFVKDVDAKKLSKKTTLHSYKEKLCK